MIAADPISHGRKVITFQQYKLSCKRGNLTGNLGQNILTSSDLSTPRLTFLRSKLLCLWALVVFIPQSTNLKRLIKFHQGQVRWLKDIRKEPEISRETRDLFLTTVQVIRKPAETHTHTHPKPTFNPFTFQYILERYDAEIRERQKLQETASPFFSESHTKATAP